MKYLLTSHNKMRTQSIFSLILLIIVIFTQILLILYQQFVYFSILSLIFILFLNYIMAFTLTNNRIISSIRKNAIFIDCFSIGHFLFGILFFLIISLFCPEIPLNLELFGWVTLYSLIFSVVYELFEYLIYFKSKSFRKSWNESWFKNFESENNTHCFKVQKEIHDESLDNAWVSDTYFVILGSLFALAIHIFYLSLILMLLIGSFYFLVCREKLKRNFKMGLISIEI
jgi:hypothetical protein